MSLLAVKAYLQTEKRVELIALAQQFNTEISVMQGMLSQFLRKGCLQKCVTEPSCGSKCQQCHLPNREWYEWVSE